MQYKVKFSRNMRIEIIMISMVLRNKHLARVESFTNRSYPFAVQNVLKVKEKKNVSII